MTTTYEHMSWCTGQHDGAGECQALGTVYAYGGGLSLTVELLGVPCDHAGVTVDGIITSLKDLDRVIVELTRMRPMLAASDADTDCDNHDHPDGD